MNTGLTVLIKLIQFGLRQLLIVVDTDQLGEGIKLNEIDNIADHW